MPEEPSKPQRKSSWSRTLVRIVLICAGCVGILLPAWLPDSPERGTVEFLQAVLLAAAAAVILGAMPHAGYNKPVCRVIALGLIAAFVGEIEDFVSYYLATKFPEALVVGLIILVALVTIARHRKVMLHFFSTLGNHAGSGLIASALLIIYVFNRVIGGPKFWKAALGPAFHQDIPRICRSYLELLGCYLVFIGILGLSITLARRKELP